MKRYVALMFCKREDVSSYAREVATAIKQVAGDRMKYSEGGAGMAAIGFATDMPVDQIRRVFSDLWRHEQRTWVLSLENPVMIDTAIMEWARRQEDPFAPEATDPSARDPSK